LNSRGDYNVADRLILLKGSKLVYEGPRCKRLLKECTSTLIEHREART